MNYKHGMARSGQETVTYRCWMAMHRRCRGTASSSHYYKNITVCERWADFSAFLADMGERPQGMSLDRIDNKGPYSPENCRWATRVQQMRNRSNGVYLTLNGERRCVVEWAEYLGVPKTRIHRRLKLGWPIERVLSTEMFHTGKGRRYGAAKR